MLHIIHGESHVASRRELEQIIDRSEKKEILRLNGKTVTLLELEQALVSQTLFRQERLIIIENLLLRLAARGAKKEQVDVFISVILESSHQIVLWEEKEVSKSFLKRFPESTDVAIFKPSKLLFRFLENVTPLKKGQQLTQCAHITSQEPTELVFYMLARQMRMLLMLKSDNEHGNIKLAGWQKAKLQSQAKLFTTNQLIQAYQNLHLIDVRQKRGLSPFDLKSEIERFLIQL